MAHNYAESLPPTKAHTVEHNYVQSSLQTSFHVGLKTYGHGCITVLQHYALVASNKRGRRPFKTQAKESDISRRPATRVTAALTPPNSEVA